MQTRHVLPQRFPHPARPSSLLPRLLSRWPQLPLNSWAACRRNRGTCSGRESSKSLGQCTRQLRPRAAHELTTVSSRTIRTRASKYLERVTGQQRSVVSDVSSACQIPSRRTRFNKRSGSSHDGKETPQARARRKFGPEQVRHALDAASANDQRVEELVGRLGGRALRERECGGHEGQSTEQHVSSALVSGSKEEYKRHCRRSQAEKSWAKKQEQRRARRRVPDEPPRNLRARASYVRNVCMCRRHLGPSWKGLHMLELLQTVGV